MTSAYIQNYSSPLNSSVQISRSMIGKAIRMPMCTSTYMEQPWHNMVTTTRFGTVIFEKSCRSALTWFTKLDIPQIKKWTNLAHVFVEHYKLNLEIAPGREQLQRINKRPSKSFREYAQRWGHSTEKENVMIFMGTLSLTYCDRLVGLTGAPFANLVQTEEQIELSKLESSRITRRLRVIPFKTRGLTKRNFSSPRTEKRKKKVHKISSDHQPLWLSCSLISYVSTTPTIPHHVSSTTCLLSSATVSIQSIS